MTPKFTKDWFDDAIPNWEKHVKPLVSTVPNAKWLEIGSFEGRSALWTLENLLLGKESTITCVDPWPDIASPPYTADYSSTFDANLAPHRHRLIKLRGNSRDILHALPPDTFHGAYIDGSHEEMDVLDDAHGTWPLLRKSAILIFDDYTRRGRAYPGVKKAVTLFLRDPNMHFKRLHEGQQIILQKT